MKNALKSLSCPAKPSSARVVDGKLILSFPEALTPVVWQMDLTQTKASALEVKQDKDRFTLALKTPKGEVIDIASFEKREAAVSGLMAASKALESGQGQIRPVGTSSTIEQIRPKSSLKKWILIALGVLALWLLFNMWALQQNSSSNITSGTGQTESSGSADTSGVPIPADEFLQGR